MQRATICEGRDLLVYLSDGRIIVLSVEDLLRPRTHAAIPATEEDDPIERDAKTVGSPTSTVTAWFKELCRKVYSRAVYCWDCGYEVGTNPECSRVPETREVALKLAASSAHE